jgi:Ca-activated chloride channel family protein
MAELHFLRPWLLLSLLPALGLWWLLWRRQQAQGRWRRVIDPQLLPHLLVGESGDKGLRPIHLLLILWLLTAIALAGPSWRMTPSPFDAGKGLVVVLKNSASMEASDVQPSRLERAKHKIGELLVLRRGDATGLIVYSGSAHLVMPLTRDERVIPEMLGELTPKLMPLEGDALALGLARGRDLLQRAGGPGSLLVIADTVSPQQVEGLAVLDLPYPVQFLAVQALGAATDPGLNKAASALGASLEPLSVDQSDVSAIARRAKTHSVQGTGPAEGSRPEDAGYLLLPLITLLALWWSRRGWLVR